jgi:hypothetical protein
MMREVWDMIPIGLRGSLWLHKGCMHLSDYEWEWLHKERVLRNDRDCEEEDEQHGSCGWMRWCRREEASSWGSKRQLLTSSPSSQDHPVGQHLVDVPFPSTCLSRATSGCRLVLATAWAVIAGKIHTPVHTFLHNTACAQMECKHTFVTHAKGCWCHYPKWNKGAWTISALVLLTNLLTTPPGE